MVEKVATPGGGKSTTRCTGGKGSSQPVNDATIEPSNRTQISTKLPNYFLLAIRHLILDRFQNSRVEPGSNWQEPSGGSDNNAVMFSLIVTRVEIARRDEAKAVDGVSMISPLSLERLTRVLDDDSPTPQNAEKRKSDVAG